MGISPKTEWTFIFLGTTALAVGEELYASFDKSSNTQPWTHFIAAQPGWLIALETLIFFVWWPIHIYRAWRRNQQSKKLLYAAWNLIANAGWSAATGQVDLEKSPGWHNAAVRWRDEWHSTLH